MRKSSVSRDTTETKIAVEINIDGDGLYEISTGIGFFDHMLELLAKHGMLDLTVKAEGDTRVDCHHTVEDTGVVLGQAMKDALGNKAGIRRYGTFFLPMDEALAMVSLDLSGRPFLVYDVELPRVKKLGDFETETVEEFFRAFAFAAGITLHMKILYGKNAHHEIEALFKALGRALREAASADPREQGIPSTKGVL
jgi:imidazoleglycerol-phosphate dehydratase